MLRNSLQFRSAPARNIAAKYGARIGFGSSSAQNESSTARGCWRTARITKEYTATTDTMTIAACASMKRRQGASRRSLTTSPATLAPLLRQRACAGDQTARPDAELPPGAAGLPRRPSRPAMLPALPLGMPCASSAGNGAALAKSQIPSAAEASAGLLARRPTGEATAVAADDDEHACEASGRRLVVATAARGS